MKTVTQGNSKDGTPANRRGGYRRWFFALAVILLFVTWIPLRAQVGTASLNGTVLDQSGAVVPAATVVLQDTLNKTERTVSSNGSGAFTFAGIPSGNYQLTVTKAGFTEAVRTGIHLDPGDSRTITDLRLAVGGAATTVNVSSVASMIPLTTGQLSSTISATDLTRLSIEGRDATELFKILPGFAIRNLGPTNTAPDFSQVQIGQETPYASNGSPIAGTTLKLDGANLTDAGNFGANLQNINDSMVSEVQVQTSNFGADQSNGPVVVTAVTKAGGSAYHGSLYTYARTSQLNSNDWLAKFNGIPRPDDRYVYPGATFGGPIPHSKKLTFFTGAEYDAQKNIYAYGSSGSAIIHALVPTANMRKGDFSAKELQNYLGPNFGGGAYVNLDTVPTFAKDGTPIVNGQLPALDPGATALINAMLPLPNTPTGTDGYNYTTENLVDSNLWTVTGRLDDAIDENNHVFGRYTVENSTQGQPQVPYYSPTAVMGSVNTPGGGFLNDIRVHSAAANYVRVFSSTFTNELFGTLVYFTQKFDAKTPSALQSSAINYPYQGALNNGSKDFPQFQDYGYDGLPVAIQPDVSFGSPSLKKVQPNGGDNVTKVWGPHTVKIGVFAGRTTNNQTITNGETNGAIFDYYYPPAGTAFHDYNGLNPDGTPAFGPQYFTSGNSLANFMEGEIQDFQQQNILPRTNLNFWDVAFYGQDAWKIQSNLVVTYGARLEHLGAWQDAHGLGAAVWEPSTINNTGAPLPGFLWHAIDKSIPNSGTGSTPLFFEPRVGFAWDIRGTGQTVLRGGYGSYRMHDSVVDVTNAFANSEGFRTAALYGFGGTTLAGISSLHLPPSAGALNTSAFGLYPGDDTEPVTNNYSISLVQTLPRDSVFQITYAGNNSNSLLDNGSTSAVVLDNVNAIPIGTLYKPHPADLTPGKCAAPICTPMEVQNLTATDVQLFRPYPQYQSITVPRHNTYANYNAMQLVLERRKGRLNYSFNYTWSKAMGILGSAANFNWTAAITPFNLPANYGPMNFDHTQIFNATYSYAVGDVVHSRWLGELANGWLVSGITSIQSGANMQTGISANPDFSLNGFIGPAGSQLTVNNQVFLGTPDVSLQPVLKCNPSGGLGSHQYINGACFGLPNIGHNGQNIFPYARGPAYFNTDLTGEKSFGLGGERNLHFRVAAFNFLNHPLNSFGTGYASQSNLTLSDLSPGATPASAKYSPSSGFGFAPYKLGRRLVELSARFTF
ncbi:MAG: carboxypeptidase-like regulatory domain-containing protein [Acidobacteriaceae bacterium]